MAATARARQDRLTKPPGSLGRLEDLAVWVASCQGVFPPRQFVRPRVVVFNNGARKGCDPSVTAALRRIPDVRAIYQMHRNLKVGPQENTEAAFIANAAEKCQGELIRLAVAPDGKSYTVAVGKEGKPRRYPTRGAGE